MRQAEHLCSGFFITRWVERPPYSARDLLPDRIVSASPCLSRFVPDTWTIDWTGDGSEDRRKAGKAFGLTADEMGGLIRHVTPRFEQEFGWPNVWFTLDAARALKNTFLGRADEILIFELGLHRALVPRFVAVAAPPARTPGFAPLGSTGVYEMLSKGQPMAAGGQPLGFEPLVYNSGLECSWLCNGLERTIHEAMGITPNRFGLLESYADARRAVDLISRPETRAEPGLWLPWLVVAHTTVN